MGYKIATNYPPELQKAIVLRNGVQAVLEKSLAHGKRKMNKVKQTCGMPFDQWYDQVAITNYPLQSQDSVSRPEPLKIGELVTIYPQGLGKTAKIISRCKNGEEDNMWGFS